MDTSWRSAATRLIHLATLLQQKWEQPVPAFGCTEAALKPHVDMLPVAPASELIQFLCAVLPGKTISLGVLELMPPSDLREYQTGAAPVEDNTRFGMMALGYWTGRSDGDAWIYDLRTSRIHSLDVGCGYEGSAEATLKECYHHFNTLGQWVDFLIAEAAQREWINESDIPQV